MFEWLRKKVPVYGGVLFRGVLPPRLEEFDGLQKQGIEVERSNRKLSTNIDWEATLRHPEWGEAWCAAMRRNMAPPEEVLQFDARLTPRECQDGHQAGMHIGLRIEQSKGHVLRDRKNFLRFARAIMGDEGVLVQDATAESFWPRAQLDDELCHDADVDVTALYALHIVVDDGPMWVHTHGLAAVGGVDFDILGPHEDLIGPGQDGLRALAFAILEGRLKANADAFVLGHPKRCVCLVDVARFNREADESLRALRCDDQDHNSNRAVVCEPAGRRWFGLRSRSAIRPSRFLSRPMEEETIFRFSTSATELMAERARGTWSLFRSLFAEFAELELPCIVKLGYQIDGGGPNDREHMWFTVHDTGEDTVDATLESVPQGIASMKQGQRGVHSIEHLSDWAIVVPPRMITPRDTMMARYLRDHMEEWRQAIAEHRQSGGESRGNE